MTNERQRILGKNRREMHFGFCLQGFKTVKVEPGQKPQRAARWGVSKADRTPETKPGTVTEGNVCLLQSPELRSAARRRLTPRPRCCGPPGSLSMGVPGQNAGVGTHSLLQGIFRRPRDQTQVSRVAGRFFIVWAARDAQECWRG